LATSIRHRYGKKDKLKSRKLIEKVFANGKSIYAGNVKAVYLLGAGESTLQAGVSVSSRLFKKAVDRNRIKRQMREVYRLQKQSLLDHLEKTERKASIFLIYNGKQLPDYQELYQQCDAVLKKMIQAIHANP
jgi:ribonuclease P protein component